MSLFRLIAGLGNPGQRYVRTRHNIGFLALDAFAVEHSGPGRSPAWREKQCAETTDITYDGDKLLLVKPQSFMNLSGVPVANLLRFFKFEPEQLLVVHDDADLPFGSLRFKSGGGDGGHNGIRSIASELGTPNFVRLKIGIGRPVSETGSPSEVERELASWVLGRFGAEEETELPGLLSRVVQGIEVLCREGLKTAQNRFN